MMAETDQATRNRHWREHVQSWQASGLTQIAYCQRHALAYHQFGYWSRKLNPRQPPVSGFTRVQQRPATSQDLTVLLPNGIELRGISDVNLSVVSRLLQQLA
jgi:hypothetical protein